MEKFRADLHIHTVLSPCADLEMSPLNIVQKAKESGLKIIGITDHNSTRNCKVVKKIAQKEGIFVLMGAEITTREEVHCLVFFEKEDELDNFQKYLDANIRKMDFNPDEFGYQPVVDENENIEELISWWLPAALQKGISDVQKKTKELGGLFIPAHVDRPANGIFSQLGFIPAKLEMDAIAISRNCTAKLIRQKHVIEHKTSIIRESDAHYLKEIGEIYSDFYLEEISFSEIRMALNSINNRFVEIDENTG